MTASADEMLRQTSHRPWPLPESEWAIAQDWNDLLFAHWPVPEEALRALVPAALEIETFDGTAWLGVTPFRLTGLRPRLLPALPIVSEFPEVNVRTYVRHADRPGIWFLSLDCPSALAVTAAGAAFHLPYRLAEIDMTQQAENVRFRARRTSPEQPPARFSATYGPTGRGAEASPGTFESWSVERYCLYAEREEDRSLWRAEIHHRPWVLRPAGADFVENSLPRAAGVDVPEVAPRLHYSSRVETVTWLPTRVGSSAGSPSAE
jgi:uncharacterized protein